MTSRVDRCPKATVFFFALHRFVANGHSKSVGYATFSALPIGLASGSPVEQTRFSRQARHRAHFFFLCEEQAMTISNLHMELLSTPQAALICSTAVEGRCGYIKAAEGRCGYINAAEGRCGYIKAAEGRCGYIKAAEGRCGYINAAEGRCGYIKAAEGRCGYLNAAEGRCGYINAAEGRCGYIKAAEGRCGYVQAAGTGTRALQ